MADVSVLISTCDSFSDCWGPLCHGLDKYWPDCPFPIYLVTNTKGPSHPRIEVIPTSASMEWPDRMMRAFQRIDSPHILYMQEDYWIQQRVDTQTIQDYVRYLEEGLAHYICLCPFTNLSWDLLPFRSDRRLGVIAAHAAYRTSLQAALWNKDVFRELIHTEESLWDFEVLGTERSRAHQDKFLRVRREFANRCRNGLKYTLTAVNHGCWSLAARQYARAEGLDVDFSRRPREPLMDELRRSRARWLLGSCHHAARLLATDRNLFVEKLVRRGDFLRSWIVGPRQ